MTESRKIFISHDHSDAAALKLLKIELEQEPLGLQCFLAHHDIAPGEHDLNRIEEEIKNCNALVYVCNKNSNSSIFCQQEIGMAKALGKKIITASTDEFLPKGFIERIQAIRHKSIDIKLCEKIYWALSRELPFSEKTKKRLDFFGIKGFSRNYERGTICLIDDDEVDSDFRTTFRLCWGEEYFGIAKIGYTSQPYGSRTHDRLPRFFTHLDMPFFSNVFVTNDFLKRHGWAKNLRHLLNHFPLIPKAKREEIKNEPVFKESLSRNIVMMGN